MTTSTTATTAPTTPAAAETTPSTTAATTTATSVPAPTTAAAAPTASAAGSAPGSAPYATASLYVGDLRSDVNETQLFDIFKNVGTVASIRICRDAVTRRSLGYAYVNFHSVSDAERALDTMNYTLINGKPCRIMWSHRDPARRKAGTGNIFIKNLDKSVNNQQLFDTFSAFGNILSCKVETDDNGASKGYGYVHFEKEEDARSATEKVNGMLVAGKKVFVGPFLTTKDRSDDGGVSKKESRFTNVYVKNLDEKVDEEKLKTEFAGCGEITSAAVSRDALGKSRGFGFVNFATNEEAKKAIADMNGKDIDGKEIIVCRAQKKSEREQELRQKFAQMKADGSGPLGAAAAAASVSGLNVYIRNLDDTISDEELRQLFSQFGGITSAKIMRDDKGISKGFGFVSYTTPEEAHKAINEVNGMLVHNKPLYVALAQKKEARRAQLEAQHAQRLMRMPPPQLAAAGYGMAAPGPLYYPAGMPTAVPQAGQRVLFPGQQMMRGPWRAGPAGQVMAAGAMPRGAYGMMPGQPGMRQGPRQGARPPRSVQPQIGKDGQPIPVQQWPGNAKYRTTPGARNLVQQQPEVAAVQPTSPQEAGLAPPSVVPAMTSQQAVAQIQASALPPLEPAALSPADFRQAVGERLFGIVYLMFPQEQPMCGKVTGMLLESMEITELHKLLSDAEGLSRKIDEAIAVYEAHQRKLAADAAFANEASAAAQQVDQAAQP